MSCRLVVKILLVAFAAAFVGGVQAAPKKQSAVASGKKTLNKKKSKKQSTAAKKPAALKTAKAPKSSSSDSAAELSRIRRVYRSGDGKEAAAWASLNDLLQKDAQMSPSLKAQAMQTQAMMLVDAGYPITGAMFAAEVLKTATDPWEDNYANAWAIVFEVAKKRDIDSFAEDLARSVELKGRTPPRFGNSWYYFRGNALEAKGNSQAALEAYRKLAMNDRYFLPAKYQQAMIHVENGDTKKSEALLKAVLLPEAQSASGLDKASLKELSNLAHLALARIDYQQKNFKDAVLAYRSVSRDSPHFYDALFEQSWALFMGGYPNHALGALHGVESPFFEQVFNPEASLLRAISYYWMCRYDDSRIALADFSERHGQGIEALNNFLDRQRLTDETAYQLFENLVTGVSAESLGIPADILHSAAESSSMTLLRNQYATVVAESNRLDARGVFGSKKDSKTARALISSLENEIRKDIGSTFLAELRAMKVQYEQLYAQAEFLYLELLMSEKEQLLGRQLHASTKISHVDMRQKISGWSKKTQSWDQSDKNEYWWDEVGFYVYSVQSMCGAER